MNLEKNYKIMDLSNPMLDENDKKYLTQVVILMIIIIFQINSWHSIMKIN